MKSTIKQWDDGEMIQSIAMGGLGPDYEQTIQTGIFELCRDMLDTPLPTEPAELHALFKARFVDTIKRVGGILNNVSGAQAIAIFHVAHRFLKDGYAEAVKTIPANRRILVFKNCNY